jgi:hypothetical protein
MKNNCKCDITEGGFCVRHGIMKTKHFVYLCQHRSNYFKAWEKGEGPGQNLPRRKPGLGDRLEGWLIKHGITKEWYIEIKVKFGLPPTCNCCARREWLNRVGRWLEGSGKWSGPTG